MTDFWIGFTLGWVVGVIVASLLPRFLNWQVQRYFELRDRGDDSTNGQQK